MADHHQKTVQFNKNNIVNSDFKIGILGGGQLGKMLSLASANWDIQTYALDRSKDFPAGAYCTRFVEGDFTDFEDVYAFGQLVDVLTIEIENVNTEALLQLEKEGKTIHPSPSKLLIIKDKGLQKQFYREQQLGTSPFRLFDTKDEMLRAIQANKLRFPFVQKARTEGYDGKGVAVLRSEADLDKLMATPSVIEPLVDIDKELAVIVARNEAGQVAAYPLVEMEFHPTANLVEYLLCPANVSDSVAEEATTLAISVIEKFDVCGLLAVELFLTKSGEILINEVAPRPHNSGHHTIDSCYTSQFQQHLRAVMNLPLGSTKMKTPSVMVNLLGAEGYTGQAVYQGLNECIDMEGVKLHLYGKELTKPFRKMGHATILDDNLEGARAKAEQVKETLKIIA